MEQIENLQTTFDKLYIDHKTIEDEIKSVRTDLEKIKLDIYETRKIIMNINKLNLPFLLLYKTT